LSRTGIVDALLTIKAKYRNEGVIDDYETEWLIEHCQDFLAELFRIENQIRYAFAEDALPVYDQSFYQQKMDIHKTIPR